MFNLFNKPKLPHYKVTVFHGAREEVFEAVGHSYPKENIFELRTTDDNYVVIPLYGVTKIVFDVAFSRMVEEAKAK